jgi:peptidoglycan hydrolase CwlO-like protein
MSIIDDMYEEQQEALLKENAELKDRVKELEKDLEEANENIRYLEETRYDGC